MSPTADIPASSSRPPSIGIRIAHPFTRESEELAHLLTSREAAQFLYLGGTRRHPEIKEKLIEAVDRYAESEPVAVRHIAAALGRDAGRVYKHVEMKEGQRVVVATPPDPQRAMDLLAAAVAPLPRALPREIGLRSATRKRAW